MFCKKCGAQIDDNSIFCKECGERLVEEAIKTDKPIHKARIRKIVLSVVAAVLVVALVVCGTVFWLQKRLEIYSDVPLTEGVMHTKVFELSADSFKEKFNYFSKGIKLGAEEIEDQQGIPFSAWHWYFGDDAVTLLLMGEEEDEQYIDDIVLLGTDTFCQNNIEAVLRTIYPYIPDREIEQCVEKVRDTKLNDYQEFEYKELRANITRSQKNIIVTFCPNNS